MREEGLCVLCIAEVKRRHAPTSANQQQRHHVLLKPTGAVPVSHKEKCPFSGSLTSFKWKKQRKQKRPKWYRVEGINSKTVQDFNKFGFFYLCMYVFFYSFNYFFGVTDFGNLFNFNDLNDRGTSWQVRSSWKQLKAAAQLLCRRISWRNENSLVHLKIKLYFHFFPLNQQSVTFSTLKTDGSASFHANHVLPRWPVHLVSQHCDWLRSFQFLQQ